MRWRRRLKRRQRRARELRERRAWRFFKFVTGVGFRSLFDAQLKRALHYDEPSPIWRALAARAPSKGFGNWIQPIDYSEVGK